MMAGNETTPIAAPMSVVLSEDEFSVSIVVVGGGGGGEAEGGVYRKTQQEKEVKKNKKGEHEQRGIVYSQGTPSFLARE